MLKRKRSEPLGGAFTHEVHDRILVSHIAGPWRRDQIKQWQDCAANSVATLTKAGAFATLFVVSNSILAEPAALSLLRTQVQDLVHHCKLICSAFVADQEVEGRGVVEHEYAEVYAGLCPFRFFGQEDEATDWIFHMLAAHARARQHAAELPPVNPDQQQWLQRHREVADLHGKLARMHQRIVDWGEHGNFEAAQEAMAQLASMNTRVSELSRSL